MNSQETPIPPRVALALVWTEKYVLPFVYALLAWRQVGLLRAHLANHAYAVAAHAHPAASDSLYQVGIIKHVLLIALPVFVGTMLGFSRPPTVLPDKLKHVMVPLGMSFYFVLYGRVDSLPLEWRQNLFLEAWQLPLSIAGLLLSVAGYSVSIWSILTLRREFGMLVSVRRVVTGGPYAYVRHPIYIGYLLDSAGLLLVTGSQAMVVLIAGFVALVFVRARLEEEKLLQASVEYRRYACRTGFLFPGFP